MSDVCKPGTSPSKAINDNAKKNWIGSTPKGDTDPSKAMADQHNKKPIPVG